jgi:hypothetical protein
MVAIGHGQLEIHRNANPARQTDSDVGRTFRIVQILTVCNIWMIVRCTKSIFTHRPRAIMFDSFTMVKINGHGVRTSPFPQSAAL